VREGSIGVYTEAKWNVTDRLRLTGGLRGDYYNFDVTARSAADPDTQGSKNDHAFSPKVGAAYTLTDHIELYGNWGQGAHSNDARGVVKPGTEAVPGLASGTGYEGGARFEVGNFKISAAYWWLNLSSELIFVGDDNSVEPRGASRRHGYEITAFWRPQPWLAIDAVYTGSQARYVNYTLDDEADLAGPGGYNIEGSVRNAGEVGIAATRGAWELSARLRYLGGYPLIPSDLENTDAETMLNLRAAYKFSGHFTVYGELLNALDHKGKDIVYYYTNAYDDYYNGGVPGRMSRAEEPRSVRLGVKYQF
jgi:outer membrane receptor protein involved in Fe transport